MKAHALEKKLFIYQQKSGYAWLQNMREKK